MACFMKETVDANFECRGHEPLAESGGMVPRKILKLRGFEIFSWMYFLKNNKFWKRPIRQEFLLVYKDFVDVQSYIPQWKWKHKPHPDPMAPLKLRKSVFYYFFANVKSISQNIGIKFRVFFDKHSAIYSKSIIDSDPLVCHIEDVLRCLETTKSSKTANLISFWRRILLSTGDCSLNCVRVEHWVF